MKMEYPKKRIFELIYDKSGEVIGTKEIEPSSVKTKHNVYGKITYIQYGGTENQRILMEGQVLTTYLPWEKVQQ